MRYYVVDTNYLLQHFDQLTSRCESMFIIPSFIEEDVYKLCGRTGLLQAKANVVKKELVVEKSCATEERTLLFETDICGIRPTYVTLPNIEDKIMEFATQVQNLNKGHEVVVLSTNYTLLFQSWVHAIPVQSHL